MFRRSFQKKTHLNEIEIKSSTIIPNGLLQFELDEYIAYL
jgi:hypothetical protein